MRAVGAAVDTGRVARRVVTRTHRYGAYAVIHDGRTAMRLLASTEVRAGERVLVTAAAGGMGVLLVQLARAVGGRLGLDAFALTNDGGRSPRMARRMVVSPPSTKRMRSGAGSGYPASRTCGRQPARTG
ncbi:MAG: hypothetical protein ACJ72N_05845 [Labedaea sp.]